MNKTAGCTLFIYLFFYSNVLGAEESDTAPLPGYTFSIGLSAKQLDFDYYRNDGDEPAGSMTEGKYITYSLRAATPIQLNPSGDKGYYLETGLSQFVMTKQNVGDKQRDLGTSVRGNYWYVTPVACLLFGAPYGSSRGLTYIVGAGVGIGYLDAEGDMVLTEDGSNQYLKVDQRGADLAVTVLTEARYGNWSTRISGGGPLLESGNDTYAIFDFTWDLHYSFTF